MHCKKIILFLTILLLPVIIILSCNDNESDNSTLNEILRQDYLYYEEGKIYLTKITNIKKLNNNIIIVDGPELAFYIANTQLEIIENHTFTDTDYLFNSEIVDVAYLNDTYYIIDQGWNLKIYNPLSGDIQSATLNRFDDRASFLTSIEFITDSLFVVGIRASYPSIENGDYTRFFEMVPSKDTPVPIAAIYSITGDIINEFYIPFGMLDHTQVFETSYVKYHNQKVYISFRVSPKILIFSTGGDIIEEFEIDYPGFIHPKTRDRQRIFPVFRYPVIIENGLYYYFVNRGINDPVRIFVYDSGFKNIKNIIEVNDILPGTQYRMVIIENKFIIAGSPPFDPTFIYVYTE